MPNDDYAAWWALTQESSTRWVEDRITRLNGNGMLFYQGGENGRYMRIYSTGKMVIGVYKDAYPHIMKAIFYPKGAMKYPDMDEAFKAACELGGPAFMADLLQAPPNHMRNEAR